VTAPQRPPRLAVLVSGSGTNLQAMLEAVEQGTLDAEICAVVTDNPAAFGLERARRAGISAHAIPFNAFARRSDFDTELGQMLSTIAPDYIALAGYMRIMATTTVECYAGRMLNIHPSLLPAYPGLHTYTRALAAGERWHGTTVHFVIPELDAGPGIIQYRVPVLPDDTEQTLQKRVQSGEYQIYPRGLQWLVSGRIRLDHARPLLDGQPLSTPVIVEANECEDR